MDSMVFREHFVRLANWFNKSEKQADPLQWYQRVKEIPDEAWPTIIDGFIDTAKFMPTPQDVRNSWSEWLLSRPEKQSIRHRTWCDDCGSTGVLRVEMQEQRGDRDTLFRCGRCENWQGSIGTWVPRRRRHDLEGRRGYTLLTQRPEPDDDEPAEVPVPRHLANPSPQRDPGGEPTRVLIKVEQDDIPF